tara:strand:+ start:34032 stop:34415 length:384 start_codon:yes stop_codon:yes gene_type:complete
MVRYKHGSNTIATLNTQKERTNNLHNSEFPTIYSFFESNYHYKSEEIPIFRHKGSQKKSVTLGYYRIDDITDLLSRSGLEANSVRSFRNELLDCSGGEYFGRESFVTKLSKRRILLDQVVFYCAENS